QKPNPGGVATFLWEMNGTNLIGGGPGSTGGAGWQIAGIGDFDGDGKSDVLWQNPGPTGTLTWLWQMNGTTQRGGGPGPTGRGGWQIAVLGDFNGDGNSDVLWQKPGAGGAETFLWEMDGTTQIGGGQGSTGGVGWQIAGLGDFNGDGNSDVLWQKPAPGGAQ